MQTEMGVEALKKTIAEMTGDKMVVVTGPYGEICLKVLSESIEDPALDILEDFIRRSLKAVGTLYIIQKIDLTFVDNEKHIKQHHANVWGFGLFCEDKGFPYSPIMPMNLNQLLEASQLDYITVRFGPGLLFKDASHWTIENRFQVAP